MYFAFLHLHFNYFHSCMKLFRENLQVYLKSTLLLFRKNFMYLNFDPWSLKLWETPCCSFVNRSRVSDIVWLATSFIAPGQWYFRGRFLYTISTRIPWSRSPIHMVGRGVPQSNRKSRFHEHILGRTNPADRVELENGIPAHRSWLFTNAKRIYRGFW